MKKSIATRFTLVVLAIHGVLLPALYFGLGLVVRGSHADLFTQHVRTYARNMAEEMEIGDILDSPSRVADTLDRAILSGQGIYAELQDNGKSIRSTLNGPTARWPGRQDFGFGLSNDAIYYIELPVVRAGHSAELRLGFDERPTADQIRAAMRSVLGVLGCYLCVVLAFAIGFGVQLSRPVVQLAQGARRIASGNYAQNLRVETRIDELRQLGADMENMRDELVGVNQRLRDEMAERERIDLRRTELERRLHHRHRVETIGTLAGGIAHEINNALLPIMLLAETALADVPPDSPARSDLTEILAAARRAKEIVVKVLTFSRETGVAQFGPINLETVTRDALRLFGLLVPANVDVVLDVAGPCPPVHADAGLVVQLIVNLCTNGYQALEGQPGSLALKLRVAEVRDGDPLPVAPGRHVVLSVSDTGHGMSASTMERIFEPFFTTREVGSGSGLGLAVVHGIIESFGAAIFVESEVGRGSTFIVYFPVAEPLVAQVADAHAGGIPP